jgi:integrase
MRGHVRERRPGVWRVVVSAGFDEAGRRRQIVRTVHGTKKDAMRELTKLLRERDEGRLADGRQPLERYLREEWLPAVASISTRGRPLAPTTRQRYADAIRHVADHIGSVRLADLRPAHVEKLRDGLLAEGLAPQTVGDVLRVLAQALARAEARGLIGRNPADPRLVTRPAGQPRDFVVIDPALARRILEAATGKDPWDAAVHLALGLGLRREEVLALRWSDIDDAVHVRQALTAAGGELHFGPPKSRAGERDLPMPDFVARALQRHRLAQAERMLAVGLPRPELVVCNPIGQPFQPATFSGMWRDFAKASGFEGVTFHTLRHGAATLLLAAGVPDAVAAAIMGHADTKILRRYQDVVADLKRQAATGMERLLGGTR